MVNFYFFGLIAAEVEGMDVAAAEDEKFPAYLYDIVRESVNHLFGFGFFKRFRHYLPEGIASLAVVGEQQQGSFAVFLRHVHCHLRAEARPYFFEVFHEIGIGDGDDRLFRFFVFGRFAGIGFDKEFGQFVGAERLVLGQMQRHPKDVGILQAVGICGPGAMGSEIHGLPVGRPQGACLCNGSIGKVADLAVFHVHDKYIALKVSISSK